MSPIALIESNVPDIPADADIFPYTVKSLPTIPLLLKYKLLENKLLEELIEP